MKQLIDTTQEIYSKLYDIISKEDAQEIVRCLLSLRGLTYEFQNYTEKVLKDIGKFTIQSDMGYYPCDILELRQILRNDCIFNLRSLCLFSLGFAKKYFNEYSLLLGLKIDKSDFTILGSVVLCHDDTLYLSKKLKNIYVSKDLSEHQILSFNNIINDEKIMIDVNMLGEVTGLDEPVLANKKSFYNLYKETQVVESLNINLNQEEKQIFDFLVNAKNNIPAARNVEMRVVGGWVRDKLLGSESDDIDIAISNMSGIEFANLISQYAKQNNIQSVGDSYAVSLEKTTGNEGQKSSQLMVGSIPVFGNKIEFVPMRTETYNKTSRKPEIVQTNDVREDVLRRDLTINALYYNIETKRVEDYVNGLSDLKSMTLKTPLDPVKTFTDDPLRMLRVLRFYSRFPNAKIDPTIIEAMKSQEVLDRYDKLASERAAPEFTKMMQGARPSDAVRILLDTGLYKKVLGIGNEIRDINMDQQTKYHDLTVKEHILSVIHNLDKMSKENSLPAKERGWLNTSAFFHDFGKLYPNIQRPHPKRPGQMQYIGHEKESAKFAREVMTRMGFQQDAKNFIESVVLHHMRPHRFNDTRELKQRSKDKQMGRFLRDVGDLYEHIISHSLADSMGKTLSPEEIEEMQRSTQIQRDEIQQYKDRMQDRVSKPVIDGNKIRSIVESIAPELASNNGFVITKKTKKPVHYLAYAIDKIIEQQWIGAITTTEEAEDFVRKNAKNWENLWKSTRKMASIKLADASDGTDGTTNPATALYEDQEIVHMNYEVYAPFNLGDKVRLRAGGLTMSNITGRVVGIKNNKMTIELQTGKYKGNTVVTDLSDAAKLSLTWEKIQ